MKAVRWAVWWLWMCSIMLLAGCFATWIPTFCEFYQGFEVRYKITTDCPGMSPQGEVYLRIPGGRGDGLGLGREEDRVLALFEQQGMKFTGFTLYWFDNEHCVETPEGKKPVQSANNTAREPRLAALDFVHKTAATGSKPSHDFQYLCQVKPQHSTLHMDHNWVCNINMATVPASGRLGLPMRCSFTFTYIP